MGTVDTHTVRTRRDRVEAARSGVRRNARRMTLLAWDSGAWLVGLSAGTWLRYEGDAAEIYLSVRFGNVLGSRGSVLSRFTEQLGAGGPITVIHPEVTRFFMTIPEAVELVVHAAAIGRPGEALVLDMGGPVRIDDVAHQLMEIAGRSVRIIYTGLRPGEKLHEELFGDGERDQRPIHPAVSHVAVPPLPIAWAREHVARVGPAQAIADLPLFVGPGGRPGAEASGPLLPLHQQRP